jgi:hypothetical protein
MTVVTPSSRLIAGGRFVEEQDPRATDQGAGKKRPLLLSTRQVADVPVAEFADAEPLQRFGDLAPVAPARPGPGSHPTDLAHQDDVFDADRESPIDRLDLRDVTDAGRWPSRCDGSTTDDDLAIDPRHQSEHRAQ